VSAPQPGDTTDGPGVGRVRDGDGSARGDARVEPWLGGERRSADRRAERARDAAEASRDRFAFLAETSRVLAASLDYEATLATVAGMSLPYLGAWCIVDVGTADTDIRRLAVLHPDPAREAVARALHERYPPHPDDRLGAPRVIRTGRPELVAEVSDAAMQAVARDAEHLRLLRALGLGAYVIVPMVARGRVLGAITFVTAEAGRRFGDLDLVLADDLASRAALAVDNARLHEEAIEARRVAEAANRAKGEFLAVMSHELRTPLNAIGGYAELIELGVRGPVTAEQRVDLARLQRSQRHLLGLINGVLNYSRAEAGAVEYAVQDVPLAEALAACEAMTAPQCSARRIALESAACDPALRVRADAEKLQQIVLNLLTNAVKFTEPGGRITLGCAVGIGTVAVTVADTGPGIAPDHLSRVFEPFVQVDARLTRPQGGVGLGLAISRDLARGMGGDLTAESTPGVGSAFTLTLPAA
jgi:signal transduction histidine kinase